MSGAAPTPRRRESDARAARPLPRGARRLRRHERRRRRRLARRGAGRIAHAARPFPRRRSTSARAGFAKCRCLPASSSAPSCPESCYVTFRFDSLTHGGDWAFVSMRGEMRPAAGPGAASGPSSRRESSAARCSSTRSGGWLTESWFTHRDELGHHAPADDRRRFDAHADENYAAYAYVERK